ncbi:hypothetical protein LTS18_000178, partial [Coniosporium uncinatum]
RLLELEEETNALKQQLATASAQGVRSLSTARQSESPSVSQERSEDHATVEAERLPRFDRAVTDLRARETAALIDPLSTEPAIKRIRQTAGPEDQTTARMIDGLELQPSIIDDCFELYFRDYHPQIPVIDASLTANYAYSRSQLLFWTIIAIGSRSGSGHAALASLDVYNEQEQFKSLLQKLPPSLRVQLRLNGIIERAHKALLEVGLLTMTLQQERTMDSLLRVFESEISGAEASLVDPDRYRNGLFGSGQAPSSNQWDRLYISIARQDIAAMHFYKTETFDVQSAMTIFEASATFFALVEDMEHDQKLSAHCPRYIFSSALVGVAFLARVMKGPFASYLDLDRGSKLYRVAIDFLKSCSIEKGDLPDRSSTFAEQMWLSNKVFKNPDGTPYIALRVRTRLSGSPLHDAIKWWRDEFVEERDEDRQGAHQEFLPAPVSGEPAMSSSINQNTAPLTDFSYASDLLLNDQMWGDLGLGIDDWTLSGSIPWMA